MSSHDAWIDLLAAAAVPARMEGPAVTLHEAQRTLPLLEARAPLIWVHAHAPAWRDFTTSAARLPTLRERLDGQSDPAAARRLLQRAGMALLAMPTTTSAHDSLLPLLDALPADRPLLVYGPASAPGWASFQTSPNGARLVPLEAPGWRALMSPSVAAALDWPAGAAARELGPAWAQQLATRLPRRLGVHLDLATASGHPRLRIRPNPVQCIATTAESLEHQIVVENRALFNHRGMASLLLPWEGGAVTRLLLRNVRARVDDCLIACGRDELRPTFIDYTDAGAILSLRTPAVAADRDSLVHLTLPRTAVPDDGFCDVGAMEFTVDLA